VRYAPYVKRLVKTVLVECAPRMVPLLSTCSGIDGFVKSGEHNVTWDAQVPLLDLPRIFQTTLATIPSAVPYLHASQERIQEWQCIFDADKAFRIGIAWQGNPEFRWDRWRSIPLSSFVPLARIPNVKLYSLQTNQGLDQINHVDFDVINLASKFDEAENAFADTAAAMQHLDLIITSDTSIAHLAGALGAPIWLAVSWYPDWRWMLGRADSPWYPTMRLFRQQRQHSWMEVFESMSSQLRQLIECGRSPLEKVAS
jgi:hypothetical protein